MGNQLLMITNTMNIITILQPLNSNVFLHGYFLLCLKVCYKPTIFHSLMYNLMVTNGNIRNLKYMINFVVMVFIDINVDFE